MTTFLQSNLFPKPAMFANKGKLFIYEPEIFYMRLNIFSYLSSAIFICGPAGAETSTLDNYLSKMDLAEVSFQGFIKYDDSSLNDVDFTFYNDEGQPFAATIDAGRKTRERIENECSNSSFMASLKDFCTIVGNGTVEIRGSRIHLSIDEITNLEKP